MVSGPYEFIILYSIQTEKGLEECIKSPSGSLFYFLNNHWHREDGPAMLHSDGDQYWYLNGKLIDCSTQEQFLKRLKMKAFW